MAFFWRHLDPARLQTLAGGQGADPLVAQIVNSAESPDGEMQQLLSLDRLAAAAFAARRG